MKSLITFLTVILLCSCHHTETTPEVVFVDSSAYKNTYSTDTIKNHPTYGQIGIPPRTQYVVTPVRRTQVYHHYYRSRNRYYPSYPTYSRGTTTTVYHRRRRWSHAAKDAVIGGAGGAIIGAVVSKHKGTGAVIGGVAGAAGGYIIGRKKDTRQ